MSLDKYLLPPYRCCGVSTRKAGGRAREQRRKFDGRHNGDYAVGYVCDLCAWSYVPDGVGGWRRAKGGQALIKKRARAEIDR